MGWFYGFKLPIITNDTGGIIDLMVTKGNDDERKPLRLKYFIFNRTVNPVGTKSASLKNSLPDFSVMVYIQ